MCNYVFQLPFFNPSKTEFLIFGLPQQLSKLNYPIIHLHNNAILTPVDSDRNLGEHIAVASKSCFHNIRDYIATSLIHSKINYFNSLLLNLPATQSNRRQLVLNSAARVVTRTPKFCHITPILKSLH